MRSETSDRHGLVISPARHGIAKIDINDQRRGRNLVACSGAPFAGSTTREAKRTPCNRTLRHAAATIKLYSRVNGQHTWRVVINFPPSCLISSLPSLRSLFALITRGIRTQSRLKGGAVSAVCSPERRALSTSGRLPDSGARKRRSCFSCVRGKRCPEVRFRYP